MSTGAATFGYRYRGTTCICSSCRLLVALKAIRNWSSCMKGLHILVAMAGMFLPTFAMAQVSLETLRTCLEIEDQSKERLDCYDDRIKPEPKQVSAPAKTVQDCRF